MKIVIFTGNLDFNVRWNVITLAEQFSNSTFTILLHAPPKPLRRLLSNQVRNIQRHGWRWLPYQGGEVLSMLARRCQRPSIQSPDRPGQMFSASALARHSRIEVRRFDTINGVQACALVQQLAPDLGIALGGPMLKACVFELPRLGTINLHKGRLPNYRGMPPAFWEMNNGESTVGCTVHKVEAGLDTGSILLEGSVSVDKFSTLAGTQLKLHRLGVQLVCQAVAMLANRSAQYVQQGGGGTTHTRPTLAVEAELRRKLASHEPADGVIRRWLKHALFLGYFYTVAPLINYMHGLRHQQRIIILLYHRVSDQFRDNVTVGIERFDQHMAYVAANFTVVSLKQIVEGDFPRNGDKPVIAVSFDDGYLDNFEHAAPILLKHQVPCTFFISTEKIRNNQPFDHDMRSLGFGLDNMSWAQVRQMQHWGLHFGSHTRNHVNLAEVSDEVALHELQGSFNDIQTELGLDQVYIAFPYGHKKHITAARIDMIKQVGYTACFSAYGGLNTQQLDRFDIKRIGINWAFDMPALKARLRGWDQTR